MFRKGLRRDLQFDDELEIFYLTILPTSELSKKIKIPRQVELSH